MKTSQSTIDFLLEQMADAGAVASRKMFGEYGLYCGGKIFALVCHDQLFFKPTDAAKAYIGDYVEAPPYEGAKPYLLIDANKLDDSDWLTGLIIASVAELPAPKAKNKPKTRPKKA